MLSAHAVQNLFSVSYWTRKSSFWELAPSLWAMDSCLSATTCGNAALMGTGETAICVRDNVDVGGCTLLFSPDVDIANRKS